MGKTRLAPITAFKNVKCCHQNSKWLVLWYLQVLNPEVKD